MKIILLISLLSTIPILSISQSKEITLIIDTIEVQYDISLFKNFSIQVSNQGILNLGENFDDTQILSHTKYPNFINKFIIRTDSSNILLPVDLKGSYIRLKNCSLIKTDTIRLNKLTLFETTACDTTYSTIDYYCVLNGQRAEQPYKVKKNKYISKEKEIDPPTFINLTINNISYKQYFYKSDPIPTSVTSGHGKKPKKFLKKNGEYKKNTKSIDFYRFTESYNWLTELEIK